MVHRFVPKHVQTLIEASLVDVIVVIYWTLMGLLVMVSTNMCVIISIQTYMHTYKNTYLLNIKINTMYTVKPP